MLRPPPRRAGQGASRRALLVSAGALLGGLAVGGCAPPRPSTEAGQALERAGAPAAATTSEAPRQQPIKMVLATISASVAPAVVAKEAGLLARQGFDAELIVARSGSESMAALLSGDVQVGILGGNALVNANAGGAELVAVAVHQARFTFQLMTAPELRGAADLRGKRIGVADVGGSSDLATTYMLQKAGLRRGDDVIVLALGSQNERIGGLQAGAIDGAMLQAPFTAAARKAGYHALFNFATEDYEVPISGVVVRRSYAQENADVVRRFVRAMVDAIHYCKTEPQGTSDILGSFLKLDDRAALDEIYEELAGPAVPRAPYPTTLGMANVLGEVAAANPSVARLRPEELVDDRFVRELDQAGYIEGLYRQ